MGNTKRKMDEEHEACRGMLQTPGGDTNWGVDSVSWRWIFMFLLSWIEEVVHTRMADVRNVCFDVKASLFTCRRDALLTGD